MAEKTFLAGYRLDGVDADKVFSWTLTNGGREEVTVSTFEVSAKSGGWITIDVDGKSSGESVPPVDMTGKAASRCEFRVAKAEPTGGVTLPLSMRLNVERFKWDQASITVAPGSSFTVIFTSDDALNESACLMVYLEDLN